MIFPQKKSAAPAKATATGARKLHSIHALLRERAFTGQLEVGRLKYAFTYMPKAAAIKNGKLELSGSFTVKSPAGKSASAANVIATLAGIQGAMTTASKPAAFQLITPSPFPVDPQDGKPLTEYTDSRSAIGVAYFHLSALNGKALGLPYDLSRVQLNGRLAVLDQPARDLQWLLTQAHAALAGAKPDEQIAEPFVTELNRVLSA